MKAFAAAAMLAGATLASAQAAPKPDLVYFIFTGYAYPYFAPMADAVKEAASHLSQPVFAHRQCQ